MLETGTVLLQSQGHKSKQGLKFYFRRNALSFVGGCGSMSAAR